ncbi:MAG: CPBP family intramembrane metalloprotease [Firmicutes bacterium]|nr:CPBP family intramembrane metalloprotease [Bacillota bacterium]
MDEKEIRRGLRKEFGRTGWALLVYYLVMNAAVALVMVVEMLSAMLSESADAYWSGESGWGYALAIGIGAVLMLLWKKREFCLRTIWKAEKPMHVGSFFQLLALFISAQALFQLLSYALELLFNQMGLSISESVEAASASSESLSMFLYLALLAPVSEEILFRGLILRTLEPYGKRFAILGSAFLFGMFHGNIVQTPYAFAVGLVLGYVAVEHSIVWAMLLHMINNLLLGDTLPRLTQFLPTAVSDGIFAALIWGSALAAVIILLVRRRDISAYRRADPIHPWCAQSFFGSAGVITLTVVMVVNILVTILAQVLMA